MEISERADLIYPSGFKALGLCQTVLFQKKFSEARHSKVSMGSRRRFFLEQKWKAEASVLDSDGYKVKNLFSLNSMII